MGILGFFLTSVGFIVGAYFLVLDKVAVHWPGFMLGMAIGVSGIVALRLNAHKEKTQASRLVENVAVLPRRALRGTDRILVIDEENRLHFRSVDVLRADFDTVIIDSGLKEEERICISPLEAVVDGMKVRVVDETSQNSSSEEGR